MSNGIVLLIVAVVLLVISAYFIGIIIRKRNDATLEALDERKQYLMELPVDEEIEEIKALHLIGQSQTAFREWQQKWQTVIDVTFADLETTILSAENANDMFNFVKAKSAIKAVEEQLDQIESDIAAIRTALSTLKEQEDKNSARVKHALDLYEKLQVTIAESSDNYGATMGEIRQQLKTIESEFSQFVALNSSGDPVEASAILDRAEEHTIALGQITEKIPAIVGRLEDEFPDQLEDLESGYRKLLEANYSFAEKDIEARFQVIREAIRQVSDGLVDLDLGRATADSDDIQNKLDSLYALFDREIKAHSSVVKIRKRLPSYLAHVKDNQNRLTEATNKLSLRYDLEPELLNQQFDKKIEKLEANLSPLLEDAESSDRPYSELALTLTKAQEMLSQLDEGQVAVFEQLKDLEATIDDCQRQLDTHINDLHVIKRFMEKRNLPGIPEEFITLFFTTSTQLEQLDDEFRRDRLQVDNIKRLAELAMNAMDHLEASAYQIVQDAVLTEQLLQYSNRYRSFEKTVQEAFNHALELFEVEHAYQSAFNEISYALETVEPGVTNRFVTSYQKNREKIRF